MEKNIFRIQKPIIAMVHLQEGRDLNQLIDKALTDVERLERGGVDGLLFENWGGDYKNRFVTPDVRNYMIAVIKEASRRTKLPYGINVLPLDYEADFEIARETGAQFVQIDTFVDTVRTDYATNFILQINPKEVIRYRRKLGLNHIAIFTNIQTKHYKTIPNNKRLETSAIQAIQNGTDVLVVTGKSTGKKTPREKIVRVKRVVGEILVFIGSGLDVNNAQELLLHSDGAIVGTGLKYNGITENPVDERKTKKLMEIVYRSR